MRRTKSLQKTTHPCISSIKTATDPLPAKLFQVCTYAVGALHQERQLGSRWGGAAAVRRVGGEDDVRREEGFHTSARPAPGKDRNLHSEDLHDFTTATSHFKGFTFLLMQLLCHMNYDRVLGTKLTNTFRRF